jgi:hypothetical protein
LSTAMFEAAAAITRLPLATSCRMISSTAVVLPVPASHSCKSHAVSRSPANSANHPGMCRLPCLERLRDSQPLNRSVQACPRTTCS